MKRNEEKTDEPWSGRRILGVAAAGAGAFFLLSAIGEGSKDPDKTADDPPTRTMKAPDSGGEVISRYKFEADPSHYFRINLQGGRKAAVDAFK